MDEVQFEINTTMLTFNLKHYIYSATQIWYVFSNSGPYW